MNAAAASTRSSSHLLEASRQRLRTRFNSKFPLSLILQQLRQTPTDPKDNTKLSTTAEALQTTKNTDYLEEARLRLRNRFNDKFLAANNDTTIPTRQMTMTMPSKEQAAATIPHPQQEVNVSLEAARARLRERFHLKFLSKMTTTAKDQNHVLLFSQTPSMVQQKDDEMPLPFSLKEAILKFNRNHAIVITKAHSPFEIVDVNDVWVKLCGYSKEEARHQTLDTLLQGPETNKSTAKELMSNLLKHKPESSTILTNYTKQGRKFQNKVRAGPLRNIHNDVTHFIGILEEVKEEEMTINEHFHHHAVHQEEETLAVA